MMPKSKSLSLAAAVGAAAASLIAATPAQAIVTLSPLLSDGMVLQRKAPVRIWGTANPGERVSVSLAKQIAVALAKSDGYWEVMLKPMEAGGPFIMTVQGGDSSPITIKDVLIGEVWVCSGQSNMEMALGGIHAAGPKIAGANDPQLRMFTVPKGISYTPQTDIPGGNWRPATPQYVGGFSAVGYYFAKHLRKALGVPVGMIHTSWGGTRIEAWTAKDVLLGRGAAPSEFVPPTQDSPEYRAAVARHDKLVAQWKAAGSPTGRFDDPGITDKAKGWEKVDESGAAWKPIRVGMPWEAAEIDELATLDGAVWYRKEFNLPDGQAGKAMTLTLGAIDDWDQTFVNGTKVGQMGGETPNVWSVPRKYTVPAGVLKAGKNVIAIRVWDHQGAGGMTGPTDAMKLAGDSGLEIPLKDGWLYRIELGRPGDPGPLPGQDNPNAMSVLYNVMLVPLKKYTIKGALWYQGESNAGGFAAYRHQMTDMITNWRKDFGVGDFPFLIVQLAPFMQIHPEPMESAWAGLREAQLMATTAIPNVGVAVITDSGDENDIHPQRKEPVGYRLAQLARAMAYGEKVPHEGPRFRSMEVKNGKAILTFDTAGKLAAAPTDSSGKPVPAGKLVGFAVAGDDGKFVWADAVIQGNNQVVVSSPTVANPKAVRFGWADFPVVNFWNADAGGNLLFPASPFRTDSPK